MSVFYLLGYVDTSLAAWRVVTSKTSTPAQYTNREYIASHASNEISTCVYQYLKEMAPQVAYIFQLSRYLSHDECLDLCYVSHQPAQYRELFEQPGFNRLTGVIQIRTPDTAVRPVDQTARLDQLMSQLFRSLSRISGHPFRQIQRHTTDGQGFVVERVICTGHVIYTEVVKCTGEIQFSSERM
ncbi:hypothetical protein RRG08_056349 [Elysia crispata]|uniref:Uncharacterized protein n=1 Tax=Elysia crispata TaxID=231223 RepID=A0AAE0YPC0_9GAST|nr:hypothetical protein RRG08_056349 [Elysia crispata]